MDDETLLARVRANMAVRIDQWNVNDDDAIACLMGEAVPATRVNEGCFHAACDDEVRGHRDRDWRDAVKSQFLS